MKTNSEIVAILNRYKNTPGKLINNLDVESLNQSKPIDKGSSNMPRSENSPMRLLEGDCLDKDVSDWLSQPALKTRNS